MLNPSLPNVESFDVKMDYNLVKEFNDTLVPYSKEKTLVDIFEEQVQKTPSHTALLQSGQSMSYAELNSRANHLAHYLIKCGVENNDNIGLVVTRGFDMIIGMYAILKAGGAYVPIDPEYPQDRQEYILKQSSIKMVLADANYPLKSSVPDGQYAQINALDLNACSDHNPGVKTDSTQLAYTIYTSGSTGRPKGVMIEHHSAVNLIEWVNNTFNVGINDRLLFITSMCFDLSVYDIFGMLSAGGSIVIAHTHEIKDVKKLQELLQYYAITFWDSVPTTLDYLVKELEAAGNTYLQKSLRLVFMSGDWIPVNLPDRIKIYFPEANVISLGGATEGTIWSNYYPVDKVSPEWKSIPYGKPLQNNFFYILDDQQQPVPIGEIGELYIGGVGVARGYANDREKTDYAFVKDPFNSEAGGKMYRTGDLGRMLPDMNMEFLGRKDSQVKIRGFRVELGEIENVLRQHPQISEAVVLARPDKEGTRRLVGYVVLKQGSLNREALMAFLGEKLPEYMIPAAWMEMDKFPLNPNDKIDRNAMPDYVAEEQGRDRYVAPRNETDRLLAELWQQAIGLERVGIDDNFFEMGGHSLMAVQIVSRFESKTGRNFPIAIFLQYPTIRLLTDFLQGTDIKDSGKAWNSLVPIKPDGTKSPLYIVHGWGLNVLNFKSLADTVDPEQPVYALQAKGLDGQELSSHSIADIAADYIAEVIEHNPQGPYALVGYSSGGIIAFEMAKQLQAMGKRVSFLGFFDTYITVNDYAELKKRKNILPLIGYIFKQIGYGFIIFLRHPGVFLKAKMDYIGGTLYNIYAKLKGKPKVSEDDPEYTLKMLQWSHDKASKEYIFEPYNGRAWLFRSKEIKTTYFNHWETNGWKPYLTEGVKLVDIPVEHLEFFDQPHVAVVGSILQREIDNAAQRS